MTGMSLHSLGAATTLRKYFTKCPILQYSNSSLESNTPLSNKTLKRKKKKENRSSYRTRFILRHWLSHQRSPLRALAGTTLSFIAKNDSNPPLSLIIAIKPTCLDTRKCNELYQMTLLLCMHECSMSLLFVIFLRTQVW